MKKLFEEIDLNQTMNSLLMCSHTVDILKNVYEQTQKDCHIINSKTEEITSYPQNTTCFITGSWIKENIGKRKRISDSDHSTYFIPYANKSNNGILMTYLDPLQDQCLVLVDITLQEIQTHIEIYSKILLMAKMVFRQAILRELDHSGNLNTFLSLLLEANNMTDKSIEYQAKRFNVSLPEESHYVIVARYFQKDQSEAKEMSMTENLHRFSNHFDFMNQSYNMLSGLTKKNDLFYIVPTTDDHKNHVKQANSYIDRIKKYLSNYMVGFDYSFGVGLPVDSIKKCHISYSQAYRSVVNTTAMFGGNSILHYRNLGVFRLLQTPGLKDHIKPFLMDYLDPVLSLGKEEAWPLIETTYAYVLCGFNARECARKTFVHHNTVRYRLEKFQDKCNLDFKIPWELVTILVCFEILKMCPEYAPEIKQLKMQCYEEEPYSFAASHL